MTTVHIHAVSPLKHREEAVTSWDFLLIRPVVAVGNDWLIFLTTIS